MPYAPGSRAGSRSRMKRWCFTINNYTDEDVDHLITVCEPESSYLLWGVEVGEQGTPHLQGYVEFSDQLRFNAVKTLVGNRAWLHHSNGTPKQASDYCKKEGDYHEFGELSEGQGKRNDWVAFREWVQEMGVVPTVTEIVNSEFLHLYMRYSDKIMRLCRDLLPPPDLIGDQVPRLNWQTVSAARAQADVPNPRSIDFFVDPEGNSGKSWMTRYLLTKMPEKVQVLMVGKRDDLAFAIDESKSVFLFDIPRGNMTFFQYNIVEMLKNGLLFSPKYSSMTKVWRSVPYVAVFSNEAPDMDQMTPDRYNIIEVN